jgi:uncharacterized protein (DUF433 family)
LIIDKLQGAPMNYNLITVDQEIMGGTPVFGGTRVPVQTFLDYIEGGESLDEFLDDFPTVSRQVAIAFLETATELMLAKANEDYSR